MQPGSLKYYLKQLVLEPVRKVTTSRCQEGCRWFSHAVDREPFTVDVDDCGEPGTADTFGIMATTYSKGPSTLIGGNIRRRGRQSATLCADGPRVSSPPSAGGVKRGREGRLVGVEKPAVEDDPAREPRGGEHSRAQRLEEA
jgi:hypothetical protein